MIDALGPRPSFIPRSSMPLVLEPHPSTPSTPATYRDVNQATNAGSRSPIQTLPHPTTHPILGEPFRDPGVRSNRCLRRWYMRVVSLAALAVLALACSPTTER